MHARYVLYAEAPSAIFDFLRIYLEYLEYGTIWYYLESSRGSYKIRLH